jgi:hypothetical protein
MRIRAQDRRAFSQIEHPRRQSGTRAAADPLVHGCSQMGTQVENRFAASQRFKKIFIFLVV